MATPFHWPGGIPREIKRHETDVSRDEIEEQVKGWLLFVKEKWLPRPSNLDTDIEYELRQRRALVQQWVSASQIVWDSYRNRAISEGNEFSSYPIEALERVYAFLPCQPNHAICVAPVDEAHPMNSARWVKFAILFYRYDYGAGHCLPIMNPIPNTAVFNPATSNTHSVQGFLPWYYLESACFGGIYLTKTGSVLYEQNTAHFMIVDEEGLKTARLTLVEFALNGDIKHSALIRPFNMFSISLDLFVNGRTGVREAKERSGGRPHQNTPLDMDLPILDLLESVGGMASPDVDYRKQWQEDVELYAPGYLAVEAAGQGREYDLNYLTPPIEIPDGPKAVYQKLLEAGSQ